MWLFCKSGFFSAVQHFEDKNTIPVRARFEGDLERLCARHGIEPDVDITPNNDYRYRMNFPRQLWSGIVAKEAAENLRSIYNKMTQKTTKKLNDLLR